MIDSFEGQIVNPFAVEVDVAIRLPPREEFKRKQAEFDATPRVSDAGVKRDAGSRRAGLRAILIGVASEGEMIRGHSEFSSQFFGQPPAGRDSMKAHPVGVLRKDSV